jgi:hypothetical protein
VKIRDKERNAEVYTKKHTHTPKEKKEKKNHLSQIAPSQIARIKFTNIFFVAYDAIRYNEKTNGESFLTLNRASELRVWHPCLHPS